MAGTTPQADQLAQVKLVPEDNIASYDAVLLHLEPIVREGIDSTFGMRTKDAIILRLARELHTALEAAAASDVYMQERAEKADELARKLKGLQLENGRLRKRLSDAGVE